MRKKPKVKRRAARAGDAGGVEPAVGTGRLDLAGIANTCPVCGGGVVQVSCRLYCSRCRVLVAGCSDG